MPNSPKSNSGKVYNIGCGCLLIIVLYFACLVSPFFYAFLGGFVLNLLSGLLFLFTPDKQNRKKDCLFVFTATSVIWTIFWWFIHWNSPIIY